MAVPHQAVAAVGKLQALHCEEKRLGLHLDCLRKQLPRTRSQDIRQWIVDLVGLTQRDNVDILAHGVSLSLRGSGRLRHPPRYAAYLIPSSPSFPLSSIGLVPSLNQPGGNVTGMGVFNATLGAKRIELTKELMPAADGIAYLLNPSNPGSEIESRVHSRRRAR